MKHVLIAVLMGLLICSCSFPDGNGGSEEINPTIGKDSLDVDSTGVDSIEMDDYDLESIEDAPDKYDEDYN